MYWDGQCTHHEERFVHEGNVEVSLDGQRHVVLPTHAPDAKPRVPHTAERHALYMQSGVDRREDVSE